MERHNLNPLLHVFWAHTNTVQLGTNLNNIGINVIHDGSERFYRNISNSNHWVSVVSCCLTEVISQQCVEILTPSTEESLREKHRMGHHLSLNRNYHISLQKSREFDRSNITTNFYPVNA
jgi:hypothetical protein